MLLALTSPTSVNSATSVTEVRRGIAKWQNGPNKECVFMKVTPVRAPKKARRRTLPRAERGLVSELAFLHDSVIRLGVLRSVGDESLCWEAGKIDHSFSAQD